MSELLSEPVSEPSSEIVPAALAERVGALIDGEVSETEADALELILLHSASARALLKSLSVQRRALQSQFPMPAVPVATDALVARLLAVEDNDLDQQSSKV